MVVTEREGGKGEKTNDLPLHPPLVLSPLFPKLILHPLSVASRFMMGIGALPFPVLENKLPGAAGARGSKAAEDRDEQFIPEGRLDGQERVCL